MKATGSLFSIEDKDVEAHVRTSFGERESLATTVNAVKTTTHKNIALNHFITRTKLIKGKYMDFHSINSSLNIQFTFMLQSPQI